MRQTICITIDPKIFLEFKKISDNVSNEIQRYMEQRIKEINGISQYAEIDKQKEIEELNKGIDLLKPDAERLNMRLNSFLTRRDELLGVIKEEELKRIEEFNNKEKSKKEILSLCIICKSDKNLREMGNGLKICRACVITNLDIYNERLKSGAYNELLF